MSDVDDELLALAGGGASSDEDEHQPQRQSKRPAASSDNGARNNDDDEDDDDDNGNAPMNISRSSSESRSPSRGATPAKKTDSAAASGSKGTAVQKVLPKKARRRARSDDESEEEGEASSAPGTPSSLQSAPMEESDSDSEADVVSHKKARGGAAAGAGGEDDDDDNDDDENKYPVDGLFASHEEKEEIMSMREVDREQILAERAQEKDRIHQNKLLRQLVSNDEQRKKRSASAADLDESQRKTSRVRTKAGETSSAMDTLKTRRAEKSERNRRREEDRERHKDRPSSRGGRGGDSDGDFDDDDGDGGRGGDSDVEWAKPSHRTSRSPEPKVSQATELRDVERVRLSRSRFGQVCFYPGFEQAITGTFVRISIGPDPETREPVYRMALVKGFSKGKPYAITGPQGQMIVTDQYAIAAHGKAQREWPFLACSDSPFTEAEWSRYQKVCHADNIAIPKKGLLLNKADDINKLIGRQWTEQELVEKVNRQQELKNRFNGVDRMRLEYAIKEARSAGNVERMKQLQEELDHLETPRLAFKTSLTPTTKSSSSGMSQQERLALLNAENRRRNAEAVRKAQLRERKKAREIERRIEAGEEVEEDHSRRVKTRAKFVHDVNDAGAPDKKPASQAGSGASTPANGTPRMGAQKSSGSGLLPHLAKLQQQLKSTAKNGLPLLHKPLEDDDIIASLDLEIDDNILDD